MELEGGGQRYLTPGTPLPFLQGRALDVTLYRTMVSP